MAGPARRARRARRLGHVPRARHHDPGDWYLQAIAVDPGLRGHGIGTRLFEEAFRRARAAHALRLTLDVDAANAGALALYRRMGLAITATYGPARLLRGVSLHRMAVDL